MLNIHPQELLLILVIALLVVGPRRLPELGRSIGKGLRELRKAQDEVRKTIQVNLDDEQGRPTFDEHRAGRRPASNGRTSTGKTPTDRGEGEGPASAEDTGEISRSLGRGLAELRKARAEIERSFRVGIDPPPRPSRRLTKRRVHEGAGGAVASTDGESPEDAAASGEPSTSE